MIDDRASLLPRALKPLAERRHWVAWKRIDGRKIPLRPRHPKRFASSVDPTTWATYAEAKHVGRVGFMLLGSGIGALDLDDCRDRRTGVLTRWAQRLVERADSYCEVTPSGRGLRIIGLANGEPVQRVLKRSLGQLEVYRDCPRYITVTGHQLGSCTRLAHIDWLIDELVPIGTARRPSRVPISELDDVKGNWRAVLKRYRLTSLGLYVRSAVTEGKRSDVIWKIGRSLADHGASAPEICIVLKVSRAWQSKHGDNRRALEREIARIFAKSST